MKKRLFVDMDGTLSRFHDEAQYLERMYEKGFFENLKPFENLVSGLKQFMRKNPDVEVFILSGAVIGEPPYCVAEKNNWLDLNLPEIDQKHRIFTSIGKHKATFISGGIGTEDYLLDDYNVGLEEWQQDGGTSIKCKNNINHKGKVGPLWQGKLVDNSLPAEAINESLTEQMQLQPRIELKRTRSR